MNIRHPTKSPHPKIYLLRTISLGLLLINETLVNHQKNQDDANSVLFANGHVVLTKDDSGQHLVITGEKGKKDKGGEDQLVISGGGGDGQSSNMIMQDASNRDGDIVMNGRSMVIPGEDGHIVLADSRSQSQRRSQPPINPLVFWAPYMGGGNYFRMMMMMPYFG